MSNPGPEVDFIEAGQGPRVILVHSSVSGARQWRNLMTQLSPRYHVIAINLFGYGTTPAWSGPAPQRLDDQAQLIAPFLPTDGAPVSIVGHSLGGSVAMKAAQLFGDQIARLVLIEPNAFFLLQQADRKEAVAEVHKLFGVIKTCGENGDWMAAAAFFADYWTGSGSWVSMSSARQIKFADALKPNFHEWDGFMNEPTTLPQWYATLPEQTSVMWSADTVNSIGEIVALMQSHCPRWHFTKFTDGGHMAALTKPDMVNPAILQALELLENPCDKLGSGAALDLGQCIPYMFAKE